jgi:hypothetical protein
MNPRIKQERSLTFRQLLIHTWALLAARWQSVLIGALSFTLLCAVTTAFTERSIAPIEDQLAGRLGITSQKLQDMVYEELRVASTTETGALYITQLARIEQERQRTGTGGIGVDDNSSATVTAEYVVRVGPVILISFVVQAVIFFVATVFFLLLSTAGMRSAYETAQRLPRMILPMIGLTLWILVRSFIWIPILGLIAATYLFPRLALAPVMLASGETGVAASVHESMRRTKGHWWTIVLAIIGILFTLLMFLWLALMIIAIVGVFSGKLAFFLWLLSLMLAVAVWAFSLTMLTASLG